jgi:hypothetical protein
MISLKSSAGSRQKSYKIVRMKMLAKPKKEVQENHGSSQTCNQGNRIDNIKTIFCNSTTTKLIIRRIARTTTTTNSESGEQPEKRTCQQVPSA